MMKIRTALSPKKIDGSDSYGLLMLNGHKEAIDDSFSETHTVVRRTAEIPKVKREILTNNKTLLDSVFDHSEETFHVYCNYPVGDDRYAQVWAAGGVEDTIIHLPDHIGEGPFARIVSMDPVKDYHPGKHHLAHRSTSGIDENPIYQVKIDYNFHLARQDRGNVNIRVDYTNLLSYWKELTDSDPDKTTSHVKRASRTKALAWLASGSVCSAVRRTRRCYASEGRPKTSGRRCLSATTT